MTENAVLNPVNTIVASAGTGKTYRLVEDITAAVIAGMPPHRVLATTFTKKAAAELAGRVRARLISAGHPQLGAAMLSARIGTVNSVCGTLIAEFAFEMGFAPVADVIAEDQQATIFARAAGPVIEAHGRAISDIAERFGIPARSYAGQGRKVSGWHDEVFRIVDLARSNGIAADRLALSAARSSAGLLALLPEPTRTAQELDNALKAALQTCIAEINQTRSSLKAGTVKEIPTVEKALRAIDNGDALAWADWARLTKVGSIKADAALFTDVLAAAVEHPSHPRLRDDVDQYIRLMFECAREAMAAYDAYKRARGLVDFVDQEMLALDIVRAPQNAERLKELIGAVFVDEYQDSSPIQIAIFSALARVAGANLWVGDPKQSIYGFRDADPALTSTAAAAITAASDGTVDFLRRSYRTRPQLATFVNAAITPNMLRAGMTVDEIAFDVCERPELEGTPPALSVWSVAGKNKNDRAALLAARVAGLLDEATIWPVTNKDNTTRPAHGGDIAILCRGNAQVIDLAVALAQHGVKVAVDQPGLIDQPEIELILAAFRWIADSSDSLALAELARLSSDDDLWFEHVFEGDGRDKLADALPFATALGAIRERAASYTPAEVLDAVLHVDTLMANLLRWGDAERRLQNIEALRGLMILYQDEQRSERQAATLAGASAWLAERGDARQPPSRDPQAVNILTYHAAKGLEWPIVILAALDDPAKAWPFGVSAEDETPPHWADPLAARILNYWPWPYGEQRTKVHLDEAAAQSPQGADAMRDERLERVRLLYVGLTRARDHLALAVTSDKQPWLCELTGDDDAPLIAAQAGVPLRVAGTAMPTRDQPTPATIAETPPAPPTEYARVPVAPADHLPLRVRPSATRFDGLTVKLARSERLGPRFALTGDPDLQLLGEAVHRFLAADDVTDAPDVRLKRAGAMLARWGAPQLRGEDLVEISNRLHAFITRQFPDGTRHDEWPVHALDNGQIIAGRLDLLIDLGDGYAIIDHKSFPGSMAVDSDRLRAFAGQVELYARALGQITGRTRFEYWLHQPVSGMMSRVEF